MNIERRNKMIIECGCIKYDDGMNIEWDYCKIHRKIKDWHDRIEKATWNVSTHLFKEVLEVVREMENEIE